MSLVDSGLARDVGDALVPEPTKTITRRFGTVVSVQSGGTSGATVASLTVTVGGTNITGCRYLQSYGATVGDVVIVDFSGPDPLVLGRFANAYWGSTNEFLDGLDLYHGASTPYIDFHRAANRAGDSNADYNVRLINDNNQSLRLVCTLGTYEGFVIDGGWLRVMYTNGVFFQTYGAGWYADEGSSFVKSYAGRWVYSTSGFYSTGQLQIGSITSTSGGFPAIRDRSADNWISFDWDGTFRMWVDATNVKNFVIDHPLDPKRYLVHACIEGPTADVFYRGQGQLDDGWVEVALPNYFEALCEEEGRTVMLCAIADNVEDEWCPVLHATYPQDGKFFVGLGSGVVVRDQRFWWEVKAVRRGTSQDAEPRRDAVTVEGTGPYRWTR